MSTQLSKMYFALRQSVVSIEGVKRTPFRFESFPFQLPPSIEEKKISYGSGVIIHPDGKILTCHHVVDKMNTIRVKVGTGKTLYHAKLIWALPEKDLAILKIKPKKRLKAISFSKRAEIGESVFAIGNPFGFDYTLTTGVISGKNRNISTEEHEYNVVLQTDTALNPGNSGGPLFNSKGKVIGINAVIIPSFQNMGFSIPTEEFMPYIKRFIPKSKKK